MFLTREGDSPLVSGIMTHDVEQVLARTAGGLICVLSALITVVLALLAVVLIAG